LHRIFGFLIAQYRGMFESADFSNVLSSGVITV